MKVRYGLLALLLSATCMNQEDEATESAASALGTVPATETATWKRVGASDLPDKWYAHAIAFDEAREVVVIFGGMADSSDGTQAAQQDTWEWSPTLGAWKSRTIAGTKPPARTGAAMAYDSVRSKFVLFGGRAGSGYDYQDTWEWDPTTGVWTETSGAGAKPDARAQHGMIFDAKAGKVVLFGGGRSQINGDIMTVGLAFGDTWEYDGATAAWTKLATTAAPSARVDFGFAYSSVAKKGYLFGGMEMTTPGVDGTPMQDTWEWDGTAGTWTERTSSGNKPSPRFAHGMAIDTAKGQAVIFGGYDMLTGGSLNDVWYYDLTASTWTEKQPPAGAVWPTQRQWSPLVYDPTASRVYVVAGYLNDSGSPGFGGMGGMPVLPPGVGYPSNPGTSREVWELNTTTTTWVDRSAPSNSPGARTMHAMAADPVSGKVYVFGGQDFYGTELNDLWEWNGDKWVQVVTGTSPPTRTEAGMAYDPARKSLILFGGSTYANSTSYMGMPDSLADTWEWNIATRKWTQLAPATSPSKRSQHGMVTDSVRNKIILYAGYDSSTYNGIPYPPYPYPVVDAGVYTNPSKSDVWDWDGTTGSWTDRTPAASYATPAGGGYPSMVFDDGRKKLVLLQADTRYYGYGSSPGDYWTWDPNSGAWAQVTTSESLNGGLYETLVGFDSVRHRTVLLGMSMYSINATPSLSTFELDSAGPTWYARNTAVSPPERSSAAMAFDNQRGVMVMFGGATMGTPADETWEYSVSGLGNGIGCAAATASQCSSGNCVDGVCCESASCSGPCKSCNVPGKVGSCVLAAPGTQVAGSCSGAQACDSTGACKAANGTTCASAADCASGSCADGVCCDSACTGTCVSCKLAGKVGTCTPYPVGTDPENECGKGAVPCQSACDGIGACVFPLGNSCGNCGSCNGIGTCLDSPYCLPRTSTVTSIYTGPAPSDGGADSGTDSKTGSGTSTAVPPPTFSVTNTLTGTGTGTGSAGTHTSTNTGATATNTATKTTTTGTATATVTGAAIPDGGSVDGKAGDATGGVDSTTGDAASSETGSSTTTGSFTGSVTHTASAAYTGSGTGTNTGAAPDSGAPPISDAGYGGPKDGSVGADAVGIDGPTVQLGHSGCSCDLGSAPARGPGVESVLGLLGAILVWRRTRKRR